MNQGLRIRTSRILVLLAALAALQAAAAAPEAAARGGASAGTEALPPASVESGLEEVIITSTRRSENLQDVPISVSVVSGEQLATRGVRGFEDLGSAIAGLNLVQGSSYTMAKIRGLGSNSGSVGNESSVAVYVDGVYFATMSGFIRKLNNIAQIEVAKGPQGTLFGRNAVGGVINITTKEPTQDFDASFSVGYGNYQTTTADAYVTGGVTENLAADLALYYSNQGEGYGTIVFTGNDVNQSRDLVARTKWVYTPGTETKVTLAADYARTYSSTLHTPHVIPGTVTANVAGPPVPAPDISAWSIDALFDPYGWLEQYGTSLRFEHGFDFARFLSITAGRRYAVDMEIPPPIPFDTQTTLWEQRDEAVTQEFQLASHAERKFQWTVGAFFLDGEQRYRNLRFTGTQIAPLLMLNLAPTAETARSWAGFAQGTLPITASGKTRLTLGGRYTSDRRGLKGVNVRTLADGSVVEVNATDVHKTFSQMTYRVVLDHRFGENTLAYASFNQGFKSGVYSSTSLRPNNGVDVVSPELVDAYELGVKNDLFDRRLRLNLAAYLYDLTDLQVTVRNVSVSSLVNGAAAEIYGVDLDLEAKVSERLRLTANASSSKNKYKSFPNAPFIFAASPTVGGNTRVAGDAAGKHLNFAPEFTGQASATYTLPVSSGELSLTANYAYTDGWYDSPDNSFKVPPTHIVNAQAEWAFANGRSRIGLWGRNLGNEAKIGNINRPANPGGYTYGMTYAPPRTYGITYAHDL